MLGDNDTSLPKLASSAITSCHWKSFCPRKACEKPRLPSVGDTMNDFKEWTTSKNERLQRSRDIACFVKYSGKEDESQECWRSIPPSHIGTERNWRFPNSTETFKVGCYDPRQVMNPCKPGIQGSQAYVWHRVWRLDFPVLLIFKSYIKSIQIRHISSTPVCIPLWGVELRNSICLL